MTRISGPGCVIKKTVISASLIFSMCVSLFGDGSALIIKVSGFKRDTGYSRVILFNSREGFPGKPGKGLRTASQNIINGDAESVFYNIPYGMYAVSVIHDANGNGLLDTNFLGMPGEGVGASNNPETLFGPPSFGKAKFEVNRSTVTIDIRVKYF